MQIVEGQNQSKHHKGINIKDLKPDKYEGRKSAQSFKQWAEDTVAWVRRMDPNYATALTIARDMQEWSALTFSAEL
eukprot:8848396-Karenia_brevis.AAC.1